LFIGNKLTRGPAFLSDGTLVDLTRIAAPVVVFASYGDNITPPQQALNWIPDFYGSVEEIAAHGHVIIYTLHESIGHLGNRRGRERLYGRLRGAQHRRHFRAR
jgi:poly(3-hydroxyalkanoate) synthetase